MGDFTLTFLGEPLLASVIVIAMVEGLKWVWKQIFKTEAQGLIPVVLSVVSGVVLCLALFFILPLLPVGLITISVVFSSWWAASVTGVVVGLIASGVIRAANKIAKKANQ